MNASSPMAPCPDEIRLLLSACIDGETTAEEQARLQDHLADCDACQSELEGLRATAAALSALSTTDPAAAPPDFVDQVQGTIRRRSRDRFYAQEPRLHGGLRPTYNAVAVTMLLVLAATTAVLIPNARVPAPSLTGGRIAASESRAFAVVAGGLGVDRIREIATAMGATDIAPAGDRRLDLRVPRGRADALLDALRRAGPVEIQRLHAPPDDARGDQILVAY